MGFVKSLIGFPTISACFQPLTVCLALGLLVTLLVLSDLLARFTRLVASKNTPMLETVVLVGTRGGGSSSSSCSGSGSGGGGGDGGDGGGGSSSSCCSRSPSRSRCHPRRRFLRRRPRGCDCACSSFQTSLPQKCEPT